MKSYNKKRETKRKTIVGEEAVRTCFFADVFNIYEYITNSSDFLILFSKLSTLLEIHVKFSLYPQHPFNSKLQLKPQFMRKAL